MNKQPCYKTFVLLLAAIAVFAGCNNGPGKRTMPRMAPPYMYLDKQPMGTNIAYRLLPYQFNGDIELASKAGNSAVGALAYATGTVYICIGKEVNPGNNELEQLLDYVKRGNEFFLSATNIDYRLLDTLNVKIGIQYESTDDETIHKQNTFLKIADTVTYGQRSYGFFYYPFRKIFTSYDSTVSKVLGVNGSGRPDYLVVRYGMGRFYFHLAPAAFSNYFLLTAQNTTYYEQVFSYLRTNANTVYWADKDSFGNPDKGFSALAIFWANPSLKYALLLSCGLLLLYIAFSSKRKRRLVPQVVPNRNDSIAFVHTIGNLYLQKKDNRNIAVKMMTYFMEHVRSHYYLSTNNINADFIEALSRKSGVAEDNVKTLMEWAAYINSTESVSDQELFVINNLIYEFYKR